MDHYPLKLYIDKLNLWWKQAEMEIPQAAVLIAGRLKGGASRLALKLRLERPINAQPPLIDTGADAIVRERTDEYRDAATNIVIQPRIPSGIERLMAVLIERYGLDTQDSVTVALDNFYDIRRNNLSLQEYVNEFVVRYDDAEATAGLQINNIGLAHLLLRGSILGEKAKDDLKLRLDGDMSRYEDLRTLLQRMARAPDREKQAYHHGNAEWYEDDGYPQVYHGTSDWYDGEDWNYDLHNYYQDDYDYDYDYDTEDSTTYDGAYKGGKSFGKAKGKGKGKPYGKGKLYGKPSSDAASCSSGGKGKGGCDTCGSKWHSTADCPIAKVESNDAHYEEQDSAAPWTDDAGWNNDYDWWPSQSSASYWGKGKSSDKGKGKGKFRPKGKGKGKGKRWSSGGKGKGKSSSHSRQPEWGYGLVEVTHNDQQPDVSSDTQENYDAYYQWYLETEADDDHPFNHRHDHTFTSNYNDTDQRRGGKGQKPKLTDFQSNPFGTTNSAVVSTPVKPSKPLSGTTSPANAELQWCSTPPGGVLTTTPKKATTKPEMFSMSSPAPAANLFAADNDVGEAQESD